MIRRRRSLLLLIVTAVAAASAGIARAGDTLVVDGDTLDWGGKRWRLSSIDTPERNEPFYAQAKARLSALTTSQTECYRLPEPPNNGRLIGYCTINGEDVALMLVREGLAAVCHNRARASLYAKAEVEAIKAARGIWSKGAYERKPYCRAS